MAYTSVATKSLKYFKKGRISLMSAAAPSLGTGPTAMSVPSLDSDTSSGFMLSINMQIYKGILKKVVEI